MTANSSNRFGSPDPFQGGDRPQQHHMQGGTGGHPAIDIMSRPTSPDGLGGGIYSSYTMGAGLEGLICASPPPTRDGRDGPPRFCLSCLISCLVPRVTQALKQSFASMSHPSLVPMDPGGAATQRRWHGGPHECLLPLHAVLGISLLCKAPYEGVMALSHTDKGHKVTITLDQERFTSDTLS